MAPKSKECKFAREYARNRRFYFRRAQQRDSIAIEIRVSFENDEKRRAKESWLTVARDRGRNRVGSAVIRIRQTMLASRRARCIALEQLCIGEYELSGIVRRLRGEG